jgi:cardiolipin synthase
VRALWVAVLGAALAGCAAVPPVDSGEALARYLADTNARPGSPIVRGNAAQVLIDGPRTHQAMFAAMAGARDHINLQTYILEAGEIGERLAALLREKVAQGVRVHVLYDSVGSIATPARYFQALREAGIRVCEFNPVNPLRAKLGWNLNNRDHRKILVVDGRVAFTGGINISSAYSSGSRSNRAPHNVKRGEDSARGWRDTQVRVEGPVVSRFQRLFLDAWALQDCGLTAEAKYYPPLEPRGDLAMRVLSSDPDSDRSEMYGSLLQAIEDARARVWMAIGYFVPDPLSLGALIAAAKRGVDVRLVLPGFSDFWAPVYAGRSHYEDLLAAGVRIYEWREALMHAKTAVVDGRWASIGSTNLDWRSIVHNYEADLVVYDAAFGAAMERRFRADMEAAEEVRLDQWQARDGGERFKEWLARRWEFLL